MKFKHISNILIILLINLYVMTLMADNIMMPDKSEKIYQSNLERIFNTTHEYLENIYQEDSPPNSNNINNNNNNNDIQEEDMILFERILRKKYENKNIKIFTAISAETNNRRSIQPVQIVKETTAMQMHCGVQNLESLYDRIINGRDAKIFEFPWMVALLKNKSDRFICSGSLIHPKIALTAAHKVDKYVESNKVQLKSKYENELVVRAGDYDLNSTDEYINYQVSIIKTIIIHPQYKTPSMGNNIAIVVVEKEFELKLNIKPICLPPENMNFNGKICYTAGWGKNGTMNNSVSQYILQTIDLPIVEINECIQRVNEYSNGSILLNLHNTILCAGGQPNGKDACKGDGGTPLFCRIENSNLNQYYQIGIVSTGLGCGAPVPAFYTNIMSLRLWIDLILRRLELDINSYTFFKDYMEEDDTPVYQVRNPEQPKKKFQ